MASNRPLLVDFAPSTATLPDFASDMLVFFGGEVDAAAFWAAQESYFPDASTLQIFYAYMMYTFVSYLNLQNMMVNMGVYTVSESQAPDMPEAYSLYFQIFTLMSRGQLFINKINYYGQDEDDVLRMPDYYDNNSTMAAVAFVEDIGALAEDYVASSELVYTSAPQQLLAFQTPV